MSRNMLAKHKLEGFLHWAAMHGHDVREPRGDYQVAQVRLPSGGWACVYERHKETMHYTVDRRLDSLLRSFVNGTPLPSPGIGPGRAEPRSLPTTDCPPDGPPW